MSLLSRDVWSPPRITIHLLPRMLEDYLVEAKLTTGTRRYEGPIDNVYTYCLHPTAAEFYQVTKKAPEDCLASIDHDAGMDFRASLWLW